MFNMPKTDIRNSNHRQSAQFHLDSANASLLMTLASQAANKPDSTRNLAMSAIEDYRIAARALLEHADYVERMIRQANEKDITPTTLCITQMQGQLAHHMLAIR